eukprot:scaffold2434_cov140-Amphora_coffeaeformis.AAC.2
MKDVTVTGRVHTKKSREESWNSVMMQLFVEILFFMTKKGVKIAIFKKKRQPSSQQPRRRTKEKKCQGGSSSSSSLLAGDATVSTKIGRMNYTHTRTTIYGTPLSFSAKKDMSGLECEIPDDGGEAHVEYTQS